MFFTQHLSVLVGVSAISVVDNLQTTREAPVDELRQSVRLRGGYHLGQSLVGLVLGVEVDSGEEQIAVLPLDALELEKPRVRGADLAGADVNQVVGAHVVPTEGLEEGALARKHSGGFRGVEEQVSDLVLAVGTSRALEREQIVDAHRFWGRGKEKRGGRGDWVRGYFFVRVCWVIFSSYPSQYQWS